MTTETTTTDPDDYRDLAMTALPLTDIHGPLAGTLADYGAAPSPAPAAPSAAQTDAIMWGDMPPGFILVATPHRERDPWMLIELTTPGRAKVITSNCIETEKIGVEHAHWYAGPTPGAQPSQGGSVSEAAAEIDEDDIAALMAWKYACTTRQASPDRDTMTEWWDRLDDWEKCGFREGAVAAMSALSAARASAPEVVEALKKARPLVALFADKDRWEDLRPDGAGTNGGWFLNVSEDGCPAATDTAQEALVAIDAALRSAGEEANG